MGALALHHPVVAKPGRPSTHGEPTVQVAFRIPQSVLDRVDAEIDRTGIPIPRSLMVVRLLKEALGTRDKERDVKKK
jgi:hypothetical protein